MKKRKEQIPGQPCNIENFIKTIEDKMKKLVIAFIAKTINYISESSMFIFFLPSEVIIHKSGSNRWKEADQAHSQDEEKYIAVAHGVVPSVSARFSITAPSIRNNSPEFFFSLISCTPFQLSPQALCNLPSESNTSFAPGCTVTFPPAGMETRQPISSVASLDTTRFPSRSMLPDHRILSLMVILAVVSR